MVYPKNGMSIHELWLDTNMAFLPLYEWLYNILWVQYIYIETQKLVKVRA